MVHRLCEEEEAYSTAAWLYLVSLLVLAMPLMVMLFSLRKKDPSPTTTVQASPAPPPPSEEASEEGEELLLPSILTRPLDATDLETPLDGLLLGGDYLGE